MEYFKGTIVFFSECVVTIVGMGLMGGSLGMALVKADACKEVRALVRREEAMREAVEMKAAHSASRDPRTALSGAHIVVAATPVLAIERQLAHLAEFMDPSAILTDMGSVKGAIVEAMQRLPQSIRAIGGHPMCGKEISGIRAADTGLFRGKVWVITPTSNGDSEAAALVTEMVRAVGAIPLVMSPDEHDMITACISHLPYLLASALVGVAEETSQENAGVWDLASSGFRDTSRVASGDLTMMMDILVSNRENILLMLKRTTRVLNRFMDLLAREDEVELKRELSRTRERRSGMFVT
jgi:prephenate dehydrogenase